MVTKHFHKPIASIVIIALAGFFTLASANSYSGQTDSVDTTVQHLLDYVAASGLTFIRNSSEYTAREASGHMQKKYAHFKEKIKTPEDFIRLCATKSILSGKPYMVITRQGGVIRTSEWLTTELKRYRNSTATP